MNRQARLLGADKWHNFGDVTHSTAAIKLLRECGAGPGEHKVQTRCDVDGIVRDLTVIISFQYDVRGRGRDERAADARDVEAMS